MIKICQLFRNFSNGANYARDLLINIMKINKSKRAQLVYNTD